MDRVIPICPFFEVCGGCDTQDIPYDAQTRRKASELIRLFEPIAAPSLWQPFIASSEPFPLFFRNKLRFGFLQKDRAVWPSRHRKGIEEADVGVDRCFLLSEISNQIMNATARFATRRQWSVYTPATGKGWLKHIILRQGKRTGEILVCLVTAPGRFEGKGEWIGEITGQFPEITSVYHTVTAQKNNEEFTDTLLWGQPAIHELIGRYRFRISPHAFFQTNSEMVETLYDTVKSMSELSGSESVWDLYAGSATIGIYLASQAAQVTSLESNPQNIEDAQWNIRENQVDNLTVIAGSVERLSENQFLRHLPKPDLIIVDPPRSGLSVRLRRLLPNLKPHRLVYVSCNPESCLRDIRDLLADGYTLRKLRGIDLFPHTYHCEMIASLVIS